MLQTAPHCSSLVVLLSLGQQSHARGHLCSFPWEIAPQTNQHHSQQFLLSVQLKEFKIPRGVKSDHVHFKLGLTTCSHFCGGPHPLYRITLAPLSSCHAHITNKKISIQQNRKKKPCKFIILFSIQEITNILEENEHLSVPQRIFLHSSFNLPPFLVYAGILGVQ